LLYVWQYAKKPVARTVSPPKRDKPTMMAKPLKKERSHPELVEG
jgi:hypothetical protein